MKNKSCFVVGAVAGLLAAGFVFSASADRSIRVSDQIAISINKASFTPRDPNGAVVDAFVYNGTTYVPMRAICEAVGLDVQYDAVTNTAAISQKNANVNYIAENDAKQAAFRHAGVTETNISACKTKLEWEHGRAVYEVEFYAGANEYEYEIDALTGDVLKTESETKPNSPNQQNPSVSEDAAKQTALSNAGLSADAVTFTKCKLDTEDGVLVYEIEFVAAGVEYEYEINAQTGAVIKSKTDTVSQAPNQANPNAAISLDKAKQIALDDAGLQANAVRFTKSKQDTDDGIQIYEIEFIAAGMEYEYEINAQTGAILKKEISRD